MSEYRRWISYIYNYCDGIKSTNAGYVRIESRCGKCRMTLNIKNGLGTKDEVYVYMFYRRGADIIMVYTGQAKFVNGNCEYSAQTDVDNVFGSGMTVNEMGGVIIFDTLDKFYGTEWDDKPIVLRRFIEHSSYIYDDSTANIVQVDGEPIELNLREQNNNGINNTQNAKQMNSTNEDEMGMVNAGHKSVIASEQMVLTEYYGEIDRGREYNEQKVVGEKYRAEVDDSLKAMSDSNDVQQENENNKDKEEKEQEMIMKNLLDDDNAYYNEGKHINDVNFIEDEDVVNEVEIGYEGYGVGQNVPMSDTLERIFEKMPGMYPFEDDDVMECVKFDPQDIGIFPMDKWKLASNSFLLHGYYTYRHLIFARRRTKEGPICMLGVPGMFRDREKFMARMFGFENFKGIRGKKIPGYGEFGYWYMDIDMK